MRRAAAQRAGPVTRYRVTGQLGAPYHRLTGRRGPSTVEPVHGQPVGAVVPCSGVVQRFEVGSGKNSARRSSGAMLSQLSAYPSPFARKQIPPQRRAAVTVVGGFLRAQAPPS